ncbi:DNA-binding transcriptional LysR family regulator [Rhizobium subbaraonis]|uniref:HTH-type transcriptional regulator TtuA n=1 Tax=Rhizobium subbaraonis TaxID=908946 RepID=A0A285UNP9_9HYPH|nr:LysR substrate-binding domain-containing protein [Rhizobium subbaraonis]SOC43510.1 DNA-binding transcriptional LysR family regulator [Rhizobium subbaraonis]
MLDKIPLETFRVFDAACRHMNFSRAGRELNITQAAVSRRIKGLEGHLGADLFTRRGKNLALTPGGERLFQRIRATLDYLEESLEPFRAGFGQTISIAASGSVSHLWLGRRLREFGKADAGLSIRLLTSDSPSDLASESNDLVILYCRGEHPRWSLTALLTEELAPVASPDYLRSRGIEDAASLAPADLAALDLIDYDRFNANWISFRQWFERLGAHNEARSARANLTFSTYVMAVDAATRGDGVALGSLGLLGEPLADGRLVVLGASGLKTGYGYYLGLPRFRPSPPEVLKLHAALSALAAKPG